MTKFSSSFRGGSMDLWEEPMPRIYARLWMSPTMQKNVLENIKFFIYLWFYENWNRSHRCFSPIFPRGWRWVSNRRPPPLNALLRPTPLSLKLWPPTSCFSNFRRIAAGSGDQIDVRVCLQYLRRDGEVVILWMLAGCTVGLPEWSVSLYLLLRPLFCLLWAICFQG